MDSVTDYSNPSNWAYFGEGPDKGADVFLIAPTSDFTDSRNMSLDDEEQKGFFRISLEMERGIYEDAGNLYSPYYRQATIPAYFLEPSERGRCLDLAYSDVIAAFDHFLSIRPSDRPLIIAGFSQGSDMCYGLLRDRFGDEDLRRRLIAVYALGWQLTRDFVSENPWITPAQSSDDVGVVVAFDCEAPGLDGTFLNPEGTWSYSINPLNWRTDGIVADRSLNIRSRMYDLLGNPKEEIPNHCGCYIEPGRGVLKVTDVNPEDIEQLIPGLPKECFHVQDYQFFFYNLKKNVMDRKAAYFGKRRIRSEARLHQVFSFHIAKCHWR